MNQLKPHPSVRSLYEKGKGFPCFVSTEQDGTGQGLALSLALARAIGATKTGAIASSVREETAMDLFAEQALWPNIIKLFTEAYSVLKEAGCSDEALVYEMYVRLHSLQPGSINMSIYQVDEQGTRRDLRGGIGRGLHHSAQAPLVRFSVRTT